ncbi:MAG: O-antigen ligase family protein [Gammaproteobacteria bacterium]|nr:O-antigen ligase family protein [Gammaproteobacteria bacterium]
MNRGFDINNNAYPPRQSLRRDIACWSGTLGLAAVALGLGVSTAAINIGLALLIVSALLVADEIHRSLRPVEYGLVAALVAFLCLDTAWAVQVMGAEPDNAGAGLRELIKVSGITAIAAGWWLAHGRLNLRQLLLLTTSGILLGTLSTIDFQQLLAGAERYRLTSMNSNELGFLAGTLLVMSVIALLPARVDEQANPAVRSGYRALFLVTAAIAVGLILLSQSRAALLASAGALVVVFSLRTLLPASRNRRSRRHLVAVMATALMLTAALILSPVGKVISDRFDSLENSIYLFTSLGSDATPPEGFRDQVRLQLWRDGLARIKQAPLLGHGAGTPEKFIAAIGLDEIEHFKHYHNFWVNTLVSIGVVGTLGFLTLFLGFTVIALRDAVRSDMLTSWLALALWLYFLTTILVQMRVNHPSGHAFFALAGGFSLHHLLQRRSARRQP